MQRWEYRWLTRRRSIESRSPLSGVQISDWDTALDFLNTWGEEGWELVAVLPRSSEGRGGSRLRDQRVVGLQAPRVMIVR